MLMKKEIYETPAVELLYLKFQMPLCQSVLDDSLDDFDLLDDTLTWDV